MGSILCTNSRLLYTNDNELRLITAGILLEGEDYKREKIHDSICNNVTRKEVRYHVYSY